MTPTSKVVISRKWNNPEISASVTNEKIELVMKLDDFVEALGRELGSPTWMFTQATLIEKLNAAYSRVMSEVKGASKEVV